MKVGILGSGDVAKSLGSGFLKHGHELTMATPSVAKLADWKKQNPSGNVGSFCDLNSPSVRLGDGRHGQSRSGPRDRTALHALVYPGVPPQRLGSRL